jgi:hypothetical protein
MLFFSIFDEPIHLVRKQLNEFNTLMNLELKGHSLECSHNC